VAATCIAAFEVLENEPERMERLWENTRFWKKELGLLGFDIGGRTTPASETPITPIIIGDGKLTMDFSRELFKEGVLGTGIAFPTVPEGKAHSHDYDGDAHEGGVGAGAGGAGASGEEDGDCSVGTV
jgi:glycine C-acetyltransferase